MESRDSTTTITRKTKDHLMAALKTFMYCGAAALTLLSALAMGQTKGGVEPNKLTVEAQRPPLQLSDRQRAAIQEALATANTEQKAPPKFDPEVGATIPLSMTLDVMPQPLVAREPSLQPYGYAKLAKELLVIDPMKKTIVAVIPRQSPTSGKDLAPAEWAATRGRELTGQAPEPGANAQAPEPAGDSGDKSNGTEQNANQK